MGECIPPVVVMMSPLVSASMRWQLSRKAEEFHLVFILDLSLVESWCLIAILFNQVRLLQVRLVSRSKFLGIYCHGCAFAGYMLFLPFLQQHYSIEGFLVSLSHILCFSEKNRLKRWWKVIWIRIVIVNAAATIVCYLLISFIYWFCFYARKQLLFSARLIHRNSVRPSLCLSVTRVNQSKTVQARITKFSPSAAQKTLVLGTVKLSHKFELGHLDRGRYMRRGWEKFAIFGQ